jgi:hypothetical protein
MAFALTSLVNAHRSKAQVKGSLPLTKQPILICLTSRLDDAVMSFPRFLVGAGRMQSMFPRQRTNLGISCPVDLGDEKLGADLFTLISTSSLLLYFILQCLLKRL